MKNLQLGKHYFLIFTYLLLSYKGSIAQELPPGTLDFQGVDKFWAIQKSLKNDILPKETAWHDLFSTPCFEYISQSTKKERLMERFKIAYMPSKQSIREKIKAKGGYNARILNHLKLIDSTRINSYVDSLKSVPFLENALVRTAEYLPKNFVSQNKELYPPVVFGIFEPDGKANSKIIALDIEFARTINFNDFLAHEAHHFFMGKIRKKMKEVENPNLDYLLMSIRQLHLEGIADLIDKRGILSKINVTEQEDWYAFHYNKYFNEAKNTLKKIDGLLSADSDSVKNQNGKAIWNMLHFGTHPEAMHMALFIENTFGKEHIIEILDNPFKIFWSYQKAALKNPEKGHVFSQKSINYLRRLEKDYLIGLH